MVTEGCIHGHFQPFHNEHLESALAALERSSFLWLGLADPFPLAPTGPGPEHPLPRTANPLTYHERQFMITRTLVAEGISPERFSFTPFPIRAPAHLPHYLDLQITCFATITDKRDRHEAGLLRDLGYPVDLLWERDRGIEAAGIRSRLINDDPSWRDLVPSSVAAYLEEIDLASRLRRLATR